MTTPTEPGTYLYVDDMPAAKPERLRVEYINGVLCALPLDPEDGRLVIPVEDMAGTWKLA
jgi:hypothetical protein